MVPPIPEQCFLHNLIVIKTPMPPQQQKQAQLETRLCRMWLNLQTLFFLVRHVLPVWLTTGSRPVLFSRYVGMGDIICTFPAVLELKKRHPRAMFLYNCHPQFALLPVAAGVTSRVVWFSRIDLVKHRWSFCFTAIYEFFYSDEIKPDIAPPESVIEQFLWQHNLPITDEHPRLQVQPEVRARMESLLGRRGIGKQPRIVFHAGPTWPVREWPETKWGRLVNELRSHGYTNIIQIGASKHTGLGESAKSHIPNTTSFVDELNLEESIALISLCDLFVGIDSGLLHVAACLKVQAVGLFGATSPRFRFSSDFTRSCVISPVECQGCHHRTPRLHWETGCPNNIACMEAITPEAVLGACLAKLDSRALPG
jgi:ADP-heptose:LPS heptosyltransferase